MSSYRGKRFVNPLSKKIGRRTGKNFLAGKNVRLKDDGFENFDDYFSESDMDITKEVSRLRGLSEESESNASQESKENHPTMSNILTGSQSSTLLDSKADSRYHSSMSQSVPNTTYNNTTFGQSTLSQLDQGGRPIGTKFGWLRNKKIGRRTGKDVTANKQIRVDEDGFENFDDYMSESDVSTVSSRLSVSMRSGRRSLPHAHIRSSLAQSEHHSQEEYTTDDVNSEEDPGAELSNRNAESQKNVTEEDYGVERENSDNEDPCMDGQMEISKTNKSSVDRSEYSGTGNHEGDSNTGVASKSLLHSKMSSYHSDADGSRQSKGIITTQSVSAEHQEENSAENEGTESDEEDNERMTESGDGSIQNDETEETTVNDDVSQKTKISHSQNNSKSSTRNVTNNVDTEIHDRPDADDDCLDAEPVDNLDSQSVVDNKSYHKSQTCTNIDVAGNLSGSITKLEAPASVVSFDRTRKRLSYSALEKSDESIQKHRKRIEEANEQLRKREEPSPEPSKVVGEFHVISSVIDNTGNDLTHKNTDDDDFMSLSLRPSKLHTSGKNIEESDVESDDDILIMDDAKKTFTAYGKVNKSENKLGSGKIRSHSMTREDSLSSKKSRSVKSETKKRKSAKESQKHRRKTTHDDIKEMNENSQIVMTKSVSGKRKSKSKHDSKNSVNEEVQLEINEQEVSHPIEQVEETETINDNFIPDDPGIHDDDNEEHSNEQYHSNTNRSKSEKSGSKGRKSRSSTYSTKKLSKTVSAKKKEGVKRGNRKQRTSSDNNNADVKNEDSAFESPKKVSKTKSKTIKRKSSSDDISDSSPKVLKKSQANVASKRTSKSRKSLKSQSTSSEDDHQQVNSNPATPVPETLCASTHFGSGVSFRVSRRSELLENIGSGYVGDVNVQTQPTETLTPCITRPGASKRKKGRRVTLCPEENIQHEFIAEKYSSDVHQTSFKFRHSYGMGDETPLPSPNSTPVHIHEVTNTRLPNTEDDSEQIIVDRLIKPSPPVEGLRRSQRTRLKPVEWYKNEQVVFDYRRRSGPAIIGVKPSLEVEWKKVEDQKRKRRQLRNQIRKASLRTNKDKSYRKLSIHVDLPDNFFVEEKPVQEITVYNQFSEMEDGIDCVAKKDGSQPVGPNYGTPKKEDPYVIRRLLSHPCVSAGKLCIHPNAEKPEHLVTADYVMFNIEYGKVLVKIHQTSVLLETGDIFMVPSGNTYSIQNLRTDNATLNYSIHKQVEQNDNSDNGRSLHEENL